jgi:hypothetical protein
MGLFPPATDSESEKIGENQEFFRKIEKFNRMFVSVCTGLSPPATGLLTLCIGSL